MEQFGGTPDLNLIVYKCQDQKLASPPELYRAPKGAAVPWKRTTAVVSHLNSLSGKEDVKIEYNNKILIVTTIKK